MAKLINGNGNPAIYASQDADLIASLSGNTTSIAAVGNEFEATQEDANTIGLADGVIITQEGRRIQLDDGDTDLFTIPTGTAGTTSYYIIGYKLSTQADSSQICETFVQKMNSSSETITEDTFKGGATDVYVSCYRVTQDGLNIDSIDLLLPKLGNITELKASLTDKVNSYSGTASGNTYVTVDSIGYDSTNKKLGLKVNGADTVIPFSGSSGIKYALLYNGYYNNGPNWAKRMMVYRADPFYFEKVSDTDHNPGTLDSTYIASQSTTSGIVLNLTLAKKGYVLNTYNGVTTEYAAGSSIQIGYNTTYNMACILYFL